MARGNFFLKNRTKTTPTYAKIDIIRHKNEQRVFKEWPLKFY